MVPLLNSGRCRWSRRIRLASRLQKYSGKTTDGRPFRRRYDEKQVEGYGPSVSWLHKLHLHLFPPATQVHHGLMYPLHVAQRAGPVSPQSTSGTSSSCGSRSAKGWKMAARGISHSAASCDVLGIFHVDTRTNLGDELPVNNTQILKLSRTNKWHNFSDLDR